MNAGGASGGQTAGGQSAAGGMGGDVAGGQVAMGGMMTPEFMPEVDCMNDDACAVPFQRCVQEKCAYDLRPDVFRLSEVAVEQPMNSAPVLQAALGKALMDNLLNLLIEPGGYKDEGYRWYVGNAGRFMDGTYDYFKTEDGTNLYPVQNFDGIWREADGVDPHWTLEGDTVFVLNVPTGTVMVGDEQISCFVTFDVNVTLMMTPKIDAETMAPYVDISISGISQESDIMGVSIPVNNADITPPAGFERRYAIYRYRWRWRP